MTEEKTKRTRKKKDFRYATSFTMRFDNFTLDMLEQVAYDEDKTRPEVIRSAVKFLYLKKYGQKELDTLRQKHRKDLLHKK